MSAMQDGQWTEHYPISALNNSAPIEFIIPPQTEKWTDSNQSYLYIKFKVTKADGTDLEAATETSVPKEKNDIRRLGFNVRTVDLLPVVANDLNQAISQHNMKIPIRRAVVKTFTIPDGQRSKIDDHLFLGQLPKRLIIGMVRNADMNGDPATNPFDFGHFQLSKLEVSIDIHNKAFQPDFENGECMRSCMSLYQATGPLGLNRSIGLAMTEYKSGYTLWGFDLTADQACEEGQLQPIKTGNLRIDLQFAQQLPSVVNVIVYAEFDNQIEINGMREVVTDY
ncbi:uncharacterized protein F54H12.2-like [Mercenaria mercenaria]|uniref:uncharacterized protein F54H12.2-like n=1 Tax=Mercenaria mercenaria TaxID=6596 RepID=UPI00234EFC95|nr:uncharacterized protein F54H12.2-like [Mercenaria mercenaria]